MLYKTLKSHLVNLTTMIRDSIKSLKDSMFYYSQTWHSMRGYKHLTLSGSGGYQHHTMEIGESIPNHGVSQKTYKFHPTTTPHDLL